MWNKATAMAVMVLAVLEAVLAIASWVVSVLLPDTGVRSLLDGEGIRWFFGGFASFIASPALVWLLLLASAVGSAIDSGLFLAIRQLRHSLFRERIALAFAFGTLLFYVGLIAALAATPQAVLLNATGGLFPSPFSASLVPVIAFGIVVCSAVYGIASGRYLTALSMFHSLYIGIERSAPLFVVYIAAAQLFFSIRFVLCL